MNIEDILIFKEFFNEYRINAIKMYDKILMESSRLYNEYKKSDQSLNFFNREYELYSKHRMNNLDFIWAIEQSSKNKETQNDIILKFVEKDIKSKKENLIKRLDKVIGKIVDASQLSLGFNKEVNGIIVGNKSSARITTIFAGGYNIQCLHYRMLVKEIKKI